MKTIQQRIYKEKELKILPQKQMLQRFSVLLAQVQKICKKQVYNNLLKLV